MLWPLWRAAPPSSGPSRFLLLLSRARGRPPSRVVPVRTSVSPLRYQMGKSVSFAACPRCVVWAPSWFSGTACLQPTSSVWRGEARSGSWLAVSPETSLNVTLLCEERILSHGETWNSGGCRHPGFPWTSAFPPPCCPLDEGKPWAPVPSRVRGAQASGPGLPRPRGGQRQALREAGRARLSTARAFFGIPTFGSLCWVEDDVMLQLSRGDAGPEVRTGLWAGRGPFHQHPSLWKLMSQYHGPLSCA